MVNLIKVKRTSIAVAVALIMLYYASQQSKICQNTYSKALAILMSILSRCVVFPQQPWRGSCTSETKMRYTLTITTDIADWKTRSVAGLNIVLSLKPTRTSANFDHQSSLSIRNQILQNIPAVMKYIINVTKFQKCQFNKSIGTCFSHPLNPCSKSLEGAGPAESSLPMHSTLWRTYWHQL